MFFLILSFVHRSARKEAEKERQKMEEMADLRQTIRELYFQAEQHSTQIREMMRLIGDLGLCLLTLQNFSKASPRRI